MNVLWWALLIWFAFDALIITYRIADAWVYWNPPRFWWKCCCLVIDLAVIVALERKL